LTTYGATPLAYLNPEFLDSNEARPIRLLSEYLEPLRRFKDQKIQDTVVFFGSARVDSRERAERALKTLKARGVRDAEEEFEIELRKSRKAVEWARYYEEARELARLLTAWSGTLRSENHRFVVTSGGGPGIMEAANRGAHEAVGKTIGLNIRLPFEQEANEFILNDPKLVTFRYFFTRKLIFVKEADAVALFPGGFGTHDEGYEVLTLIQTGKGRPMPVVYVDSPRGTFWKTWLRYVHDHLLRHNLISKPDLSLFKVTTSVEEAVDEVTGFYRVYHSSRMVGPDFVMRLNRPLPPGLAKDLTARFADILFTGEIVATDALPAEREQEPELDTLPRLVFRLIQGRAGRLRQLIDTINTEG